jgi:NADH-quinone oxidoreductase subunit N
MSTVVKTAGFAAILLFLSAFASDADMAYWKKFVLVSTVLTLVIGNTLALVQTSYKRMLAYSSISHAGFMLIALLAYNADTIDNILFYSLSYGLATVAAFGVYILASEQRQGEGMDVLRGLGKDDPLSAFILTVALASLGGIPLTAGFIGKLSIFTNAVLEPQLMVVLITAIVMSIVSVYYYFRVISLMYMSDRAGQGVLKSSLNEKLALFGATAATLLLGFAPSMLSYFGG